jgi:hypothetical protein
MSTAGTSGGQATVTLTGQVICGAMLSFTVISCTHVAVFPQLSEAMYVRVITRGQLPLHTSPTHVTTGVPQLSVALTDVMSGAGTSGGHATVTAAGHRICGAMLSSTVIICVQVAVFPQESTAWYVRVITRGQLPLHTSLIKITVGVPQLSVALTAVISGDGTSVTHATVTSDGHRI